MSSTERLEISLDRAIEFFAPGGCALGEEPLIDGRPFVVDLQMPEDLDPMSDSYRDLVLARYRAITGRDYSTDYEAHGFERGADMAARPWPYSTGDANLIGEQLQALGFILRRVLPRPGERVLELGAGWANLTLPLAQMGCEVTAIDVDDGFLEILRRRSGMAHCEVRVEKLAFLDIGTLIGPFDLIVTCASFHHCDDHVRLLRTMRSLLGPGGRIALCGEPLDESLKSPWGLNPNGGSLGAVRTLGWFELSFRVSYLRQALERTGFIPELHVCDDTAYGNVFLGRVPA